MTDELVRAWEMVWEWRNENSEYYPTPDPHMSLRFALTETGEAMDAWIRKFGPRNLKRNNHREDDVCDELADCAMMLLTALYDAPMMRYAKTPKIRAPIDEVAGWVSAALSHYSRDPGGEYWQTFANYALVHIAQYPGMDLCARLSSRLKRLYKKHIEGEIS